MYRYKHVYYNCYSLKVHWRSGYSCPDGNYRSDITLSALPKVPTSIQPAIEFSNLRGDSQALGYKPGSYMPSITDLSRLHMDRKYRRAFEHQLRIQHAGISCVLCVMTLSTFRCLSLVTFHLSHVACHMSLLTFRCLSHDTCHLSLFTFRFPLSRCLLSHV